MSMVQQSCQRLQKHNLLPPLLDREVRMGLVHPENTGWDVHFLLPISHYSIMIIKKLFVSTLESKSFCSFYSFSHMFLQNMKPSEHSQRMLVACLLPIVYLFSIVLVLLGNTTRTCLLSSSKSELLGMSGT